MSGGFDLWFAFVTGLLGAFHCIGMCIGVNGGYFAGTARAPRAAHLAAFHGSRIGVYTLLGVSGAALGRVVVQSGIVGKAQGLMMMLAGLVIVWLGLRLGGWLNHRTDSSRQGIPVSLVPRGQSAGAGLHPAVAGLFNGLVPCSLVSLVAIRAAATADPVQAGLMMLAFGAGTLPTLVGLSLAGSLAGCRITGRATQALGAAVVLAGLWTLYQGWVVYDIIRGLANW